MSLGVKPVGEPDAGNPHVRFDERGRETERASHATAPVPDSTEGGVAALVEATDTLSTQAVETMTRPGPHSTE